VSGDLPSRVKGDQPGIREELVGPAQMVIEAAAAPWAFGPLALQRAQASPGEAVNRLEGVAVCVLEVVEPAHQRPIEISDDPGQAVASGPGRLGPDRVLEAIQTLLADQTQSGLEPVAEELEPLPGLPAVTDPTSARAASASPRLRVRMTKSSAYRTMRYPRSAISRSRGSR